MAKYKTSKINRTVFLQVSLPDQIEPVPEAEKLKRLRKELKQLQMENEILKKAAAYFAKDSL